VTTQLPEPHSISERLEKIERENRVLKRIGVVVLSFLAALVIMGQAKPRRTIEAESFILRDSAGRMRAEINMDQSGTPALTFYDEHEGRGSYFREGDLMFLRKEEFTRMNATGVTVNNQEGHIDLGTEGLRLKITSTTDPVFGYASLGIDPALNHKGVVGPALTLFGNKGQGFAQLDTTDGPRLHLEPGMWEGKLLPGGFVDITSEGPLVQVSDQQGVTAAIGRIELKEKDSGRKVWTPTASVVLLDKDKIRWSAPN
jgi:hypothetical protein